MNRQKSFFARILSALLICLVLGSLMPAYTNAYESVSVLYNGEEMQFDVPAQIIDGRTMVPMRAIFEKLGAKVSYDDLFMLITASRGKDKVECAVGNNRARVNGEIISLDVPPMLLDGRTLVPVRFVCDALGVNIEWDDTARSVIINTEAKPVQTIIPSYPVKAVTASANDGNVESNVLDGDYDTRWSAEGTKCTLTLELEEELPIGYIGVAWYCGNERRANFEIALSKDGENYTTMFNGMTNYTLNMEGYDMKNEPARFVKITGKGNTEGLWNSITEVKIYPPRTDGAIVVDDAGLSGEAADTVVEVPDEIIEALEGFDVLIGKDVLQWIIDLYDPETGCFYYTASGRDNKPFTPNAEAAYFAFSVLRQGGLLNELPDDWKQKLGTYIQAHQDPDTGYFYEEMWGKGTSGSRRDRDLSYSLLVLSMCGMEPLYPTPSERLEQGSQSGQTVATVPEYLQGEAQCIEYLDSKDWTTDGIWSTGNSLSSAKSLIIAAGLDDVVRDYIIEKQNPVTGLWGEGKAPMNANGAMKLATWFDNEHPLPNFELALRSLIDICLEQTDPVAVTYVWNPIEAIMRLSRSESPMSESTRQLIYDNAVDIINHTIELAKKFKAPDGGFSEYIGRGVDKVMGYPIGLGANEGDMDGTVIISQRLRSTMYSMLGIRENKDYYLEYEDWFMDEISKKQPVKKNEGKLEYDFEDTAEGKLPVNWAASGDVGVVPDPYNPKLNKVLRISKQDSTSTSCSMSGVDSVPYETVSFSCKMMIEEITGGTGFFYNTMGSPGVGSGAVQWTIYNGGVIGSRKMATGNPTSLFTMEAGEWFDFRIEYSPDTMTTSLVKYYIDGELVAESNIIYTGETGTQKEPYTDFTGIHFKSFNDGKGTFYLDDVKVEFK